MIRGSGAGAAFGIAPVLPFPAGMENSWFETAFGEAPTNQEGYYE
jgi:hypothetical protein